MIDKKDFRKAVADPFKQAMYVKKGQSWYLDGEDAVIVVNFQKSNFNEEYFMNIGIWLKAFGVALFPKENLCHLSFRVERLFPEDWEIVRNGLSLEKANQQTLLDLSEFIKLKLIPFLEDCTKKHKLVEFMATGRFKSGLINKEAKDFLS
jgi:hypothetical protein